MKGLRTFLSIGIIILLGLSNYTISQGVREDLSQPVVTAFKSSEANLLEVDIKVKEKLSEKYLTEEELVELGEELVDKFNIVGELQDKNQHYNISEDTTTYNSDYIQDENQRKLIITGKDKRNNSIKIILLTYGDKYSNLEKTELVVNIITTELEEYDNTRKNIVSVFEELKREPEINTCIVGTFSGNVENTEKLKIVSNIMGRINAREVEKYSQPDIISISAYSPNIENHISTGNKKMNLNIAMRHNYTEDKTYIWIATPIISGGY